MKKIILYFFIIASLLNAKEDTFVKMNEYCIDSITSTNTRGEVYSLDICIASSTQFNKYILFDNLIYQISSRAVEELFVSAGKELLKEELLTELNSSAPIYFSRFKIVPYTPLKEKIK